MAATRYSQFKSRVRYYLAALGLGDWRLREPYRSRVPGSVPLRDGQRVSRVYLAPEKVSI